MLKHGGEIIVEWMFWIYDLAWKQREVPDEWRRAVIVPLHKGKGSKSECNNYRVISLLSVPVKVYRRILTERVMELTEKKVREESQNTLVRLIEELETNLTREIQAETNDRVENEESFMELLEKTCARLEMNIQP